MDKMHLLFKDLVFTALYTLSTSVIKTNPLMTYKAKVIVSSDSHSQHINAM